MSSSKQRQAFLTKIAQQAVPTTTSSTPTTPAPPAFQASQVYGYISGAYNSQTVMTLNNLISTLNIALHYASNGQFNFQILRNQGFQVDISGAPNVDAKNLLTVSMIIYKTFLNAGGPFLQQVSAQQITNWTTMIGNSSALMNLSQINPTGIIAQKLPGNLKDNILNYLKYIALYNPIK